MSCLTASGWLEERLSVVCDLDDLQRPRQPTITLLQVLPGGWLELWSFFCCHGNGGVCVGVEAEPGSFGVGVAAAVSASVSLTAGQDV